MKPDKTKLPLLPAANTSNISQTTSKLQNEDDNKRNVCDEQQFNVKQQHQQREEINTENTEIETSIDKKKFTEE